MTCDASRRLQFTRPCLEVVSGLCWTCCGKEVGARGNGVLPDGGDVLCYLARVGCRVSFDVGSLAHQPSEHIALSPANICGRKWLMTFVFSQLVDTSTVHSSRQVPYHNCLPFINL